MAESTVELEHLLVRKENGRHRVFGNGHGISADGVDDLNAAAPDRIVDETFYRAGKMGNQLEARCLSNEMLVDAGAAPAGDQDFYLGEVRGHVFEVAKRRVADKIAHTMQCIHVVGSKQFVSDHRMHEHCG